MDIICGAYELHCSDLSVLAYCTLVMGLALCQVACACARVLR